MQVLKYLYVMILVLPGPAQAQWNEKELVNSSSQVEVLDYAESVKVKAKRFRHPRREVSLIVTKEGYYPKHVSVFKGERVTFFVTATTEVPNCFILAGKDVFLAANKGHVSEGHVTFDHAGTFKFYCPATKISGHVTVIERPKVKEVLQRKIASKNPYRHGAHWRPREF